ncbi:hypothetical protein [Microcystis phage MinS1]|nr:hypothetical protein [Microcystis phage MinS1]
MNHLQLDSVERCSRSYPHASHRYVTSPDAELDQLCPGRPRVLSDVLALAAARPVLAEVSVGATIARLVVSAA